MSIRADLRTYLLTKASVTALIGTRIYPQEAKQGVAYPRIIYRETGGDRTNSLSGANEQVKTSFELTCQSEDGDEAKAIADALENVLDCFQGTMNGTTVQGMFTTNSGDILDEPVAGNEKSIKESIVNVDLWFEKAVPSYT
jgi:hypothetical protein